MYRTGEDQAGFRSTEIVRTGLGEETAAYCLLRFRATPGNPKEATVMAESSTG